MARHLKPGGWIEHVEGSVVPKSDDGTVKPGDPLHQWGEISIKCGDDFGKTLRVVDESKQNIIQAGFVDVVEHRYKWPIGGVFSSIWNNEKPLADKRTNRLAT
jgi:hypothetical protein